MNKSTLILGASALTMLYLGLTQIALLTGIATGLTHLLTKEKTSSPNNSSNVKVQPIKVKREYDGPDSIYPDDMSINLSPHKTGAKADLGKGLGYLGKCIGAATKKIGGGSDED